jgi:hypothetical protein
LFTREEPFLLFDTEVTATCISAIAFLTFIRETEVLRAAVFKITLLISQIYKIDFVKKYSFVRQTSVPFEVGTQSPVSEELEAQFS